MLFPMRFNTPFRMFPLLTVQGGFVHVDMRFNFENCYNFYRAGVQLALAICVAFLLQKQNNYDMLTSHKECGFLYLEN